MIKKYKLEDEINDFVKDSLKKNGAMHKIGDEQDSVQSAHFLCIQYKEKKKIEVLYALNVFDDQGNTCLSNMQIKEQYFPVEMVI